MHRWLRATLGDAEGPQLLERGNLGEVEDVSQGNPLSPYLDPAVPIDAEIAERMRVCNWRPDNDRHEDGQDRCECSSHGCTPADRASDGSRRAATRCWRSAANSTEKPGFNSST